MNNINQYIFDICHVLAHLRDTLEYVLPRDHDAKVFEQRKTVLTKGLDPETPLGKFFENNKEQFQPTVDKYKEMLNELYSDQSTILTKTADGKIRVDHTQHLKIYDYVATIAEPIRDVFYFHINLSKQRNESDPRMIELGVVDDRYYRLFLDLLLLQDFQKSFAEFQKVMGESQGKPTPQSNFIVTNELQKMATILRNVRSKTHFTDNASLDTLDNVNKLIEMTEGRRDRIDNKPFPELFKTVLEDLNKSFTAVIPVWQKAFDELLKEMLEDIKKGSTPAPSQA